MAQRPHVDSRTYYRVETRLPIRCRRAGAGDVAAVEQRLALGGESPHGELPPQLGAWLRHLEAKLDRLLSLLDASHPRPLDPGEARPVVISGGGLLIEHPDDGAQAGDPYVVDLLLPGDPPQPICAIAEMVDRRAPHGGRGERTHLSLRFRRIDEADRDAIVRMVYRVQLTELRVERALDGDQR